MDRHSLACCLHLVKNPLVYEDICLTPPVDDDYGLEMLAGIPAEYQLMRELNAYMLTQGKYGRYKRRELGIVLENTRLKSALQHMVNCCMLLWPKEFLLNEQGIRNNYAIDVLDVLCNYTNVGLAGCASSGKTYTMAAWAVVDWLAAPNCTSTYVASVDLSGTSDRIWGKVEELYLAAMRNLKAKFQRNIKMGELVSYQKMIAYENIDPRDEKREQIHKIQAVAFEAGNEGHKAIVKVQGRKNWRVRLLVDELAEMESMVLDARVNLRSNMDFIFAGAANPSNRPNNPHKELCEPKDPRSWGSVTINTHFWETKSGVALHLAGNDSPNFRAPDPDYPPYIKYLTEERRLEILNDCDGQENHTLYWRMVHGWWADASVEQTVISRAFIAQCQLNREPVWRGPTRVVAGFDTGFTAGGDRCVLSFFRVGIDDSGRMVGFFLGYKELASLVGTVFEDSISVQVVALCMEMGVAPADFGMDISSDGGKVMRAIIIEWTKYDDSAPYVFPISSMGPPTERPISSKDSRRGIDVYDRRVTEYWFAVHTAMTTRSLWGLDLAAHKPLVDELCFRLYEHKGKKVSVETKRDMKARMKRSPDISDSFVYGTEMCRRAGVNFFEAEEERDSEAEDLRRFENRVFKREEEAEEDESEMAYSGQSVDEDGW